MTTCESLQAVSLCTPISLARLRPAIIASYSASLFVALKPQLIAVSRVSPFGEVRTIPSQLPLKLLKPSMCRVHIPSCGPSAYSWMLGVKSVMKSVNTYDLIVVRGWKVMSNSLSSTAHFASLPNNSGLCNMVLIGNVVNIGIGWHWK